MKRWQRWLAPTLLIFGMSVGSAARGQDPIKRVSGPIHGSVVWSDTVLMTGDVTIPQGARLTIQPGTRVEAVAGGDDRSGGSNPSLTELIVDGGWLNATGTLNLPIQFTSSATSPQRGNWEGVRYNSGILLFDYCRVEYANTGLAILGTGQPFLQRSLFQNNATYGVEFAASAAVSDSLVQQNGMGVYVHAAVSAQLNNVRVLSNDKAGIFGATSRIAAGSAVTLTNCTVRDNGGTAAISGSTLNISNSQIKKNRAERGVVGENVTLTDSNVSYNTGDGVTATSTSNITGSAIRHNTGPGVVMKDGSLTNSFIASNDGDGVHSTSPTVQIQGNRILRNGTIGLILDVQSGNASLPDLVVNGNLIWGNDVGLAVLTSQPRVTMGNVKGNDIYNNTSYELHNVLSSTLIFTQNDYWGPQTTQEWQAQSDNLSKVKDSRDDSLAGPVIFQTVSPSLTTNLSGITQNTPSGVNVTVVAPNTSITLSAVGEAGNTTTLSVATRYAGPAPDGYEWAKDGSTLDLDTTAELAGPATVCMDLPATFHDKPRRGLRIFHEENGDWVDRTVPSNDPTKICARASSFSFFVIGHKEPLMGDVNGDGSVNVADAILTLRASAKQTELDEDQQTSGDVDKNNLVNVSDAIKILRVSAKVDPPFTQ